MVAVKKLHKCLPPSRSDFDWREAKAQKALAGYIFVCCRATLPDLERNNLFGLPAHHQESVRAIRRGMPLFLFNYSNRLLYGVFEAASDGGFNIDPYAWENTDSTRSSRHLNPVSRYPAQVRVHMRLERPPLDEETFRPVLDNLEVNKFRLDLTARQVQELLHLFGEAGSASEREFGDERNRDNFYPNVSSIQDPESPRSAFKSDSDCYSECSSRGTNFGEDEWIDEAPNEQGVHRESMYGQYQRENGEGILGDRLSHLALEDVQSNRNGLLENEFDQELLYSASLISGASATSEDSHSSASDSNGQQMAWKESSRKAAHRARAGAFQPLKDDGMLARLHDIDPAVNSSSINCMQPSVIQPLTMNRQDDVGAISMIPSQVQAQFPGGENLIFIPVQTVHCQQRGIPSFSVQQQRSKWNDQRKLLRGWSTPNSRKQNLSQDKNNKPKDVRYHKQHLLSDNQQPPIQSQKFQLGQVLVPLYSRRSGPLHEEGHMATLLSPVFMSPNGQGLPFSQPPIGAGVEDSDEGFETLDDTQLNPEGLQSLLQNGHFPILLMPSIMPRIPASPPVITAGFVEALHFDVLHFARWTRPSPETQRHAEAAIDCVRKGVKTVWPDADVEVFGSFATGLCLQHSDVDLAVVNAPLVPSSESLSIAQASVFLIRELAAALEAYKWCESIHVLDTASMPVLKCRCQPFVAPVDPSMLMPAIAIDITIGCMRNSNFVCNQETRVLDTADPVPKIGQFVTRHTGGAAREYVLHKIWDLPALAPLVLLLKSFLHHIGLSNVYSGGLGSFSLTLLVAFYLERVPISREVFMDGMSGDLPVSPTATSPLSCASEFSDDSDIPSSRSSYGGFGQTPDFGICNWGDLYVRRAANVMDRVLTLWGSGGSPYLGTLLLGFLQTFGFQLDLSCEKIVLKGVDGSAGGIFKRDNRHVALWIDDPLRPGVNIGAGSFGMFHVQAAFREMLQVLTKRQFLASPPHCNEKGCQDLAAMGRLPQLSRLLMEVDDYQ